MDRIQIKNIEAQLQSRQRELLVRLEKVKKDVTAEHSPDWSEQAQERQNDEVIQAIGNESREELNQVGLALERITNNEYTTCSQCGGDINIDRLKAVPYTSLCIQCANNQ
jgi:RNA polymerase-binding protein DksA